MDEIKQEKNETRQCYLLRVAHKVLRDNADYIDSFIYDEQIRDASRLADDMKSEFYIND